MVDLIKHQLIYSTHSPFMIDPQRFERAAERDMGVFGNENEDYLAQKGAGVGSVWLAHRDVLAGRWAHDRAMARLSTITPALATPRIRTAPGRPARPMPRAVGESAKR